MQALDTTGRDAATARRARPSPPGAWETIRSSTPCAVVLAGRAALAAMASTLSPAVPVATGLCLAALVVPALVDVREHRLPNPMVAAGAAVGLFASVATALVGGDVDVVGAAIGALLFATPPLLLHLVAPRSMGFGDVKLAAVLGAALGLIDPLDALVALTLASLIGSAAGLVARRRTIAFGPALVAGAVVTVVAEALTNGMWMT